MNAPAAISDPQRSTDGQALMLNETENGPATRAFFLKPLFLFIVILPTLLSTIYFGFVADDVYISEASFVVRSPTRATVSPLGAILSSTGYSGSTEETNAVLEYVQSRDGLQAINRDGLVRNAYLADKANWIDRFGGLFGGTSQEHLYKYFLKKVMITTDPVTQMAKLTVRAYTPEEAQLINLRLVEKSEELVNQLSQRAQADTVAVTQQEVAYAQDKVKSASVALAKFRNRAQIIDPEKQAEISLQMISKLQDELITTRTQLQQFQTYTPQASQIPFLRTRVKSLEREITQQTNKVAGGKASLSASAGKYQELRLESELSEKLLGASVAALEEAKADARRKRAYVERVSDPSLPDYAMEPMRLRGILATLLLSLLAWGITTTLTAGIREHRDG